MNSIRAGVGLGACDQCSRIVSLPAGNEELGLIGGRSNGATEGSLAGGAIVSDFFYVGNSCWHLLTPIG